MSNEITPSKTFEQRMFEKIRDHMGDLMTDEDLRKLVGSAMQRAFFEPRINTDYSGYGQPEKLPPLFIDMVQKNMQNAVSDAVSRWIDEHPEQVTKALTETIEAGIFGMMVSHFSQKTSSPLHELLYKLTAKGVL